MTYLLLSVPFVLLAAALAVLARARTRRSGRALPDVAVLGLVLAALVVLTVVFDNLMIAAGLFEYGEGTVLGVLLGRVPVEDLLYPLVAVLALPALWHLGGAPDPGEDGS